MTEIIVTGRGVKVDRYLQTNIEDVYAIGDCAEQHEGIGQRRPIEAVWYTGRMMAETLARTICGTPTQYNPGHWFNSAKFLDIEYQTYGANFDPEFYAKHEKEILAKFNKENNTDLKPLKKSWKRIFARA